MKEYLEELNYMNWVILAKFERNELDIEALERLIRHITSLAYTTGRKHERKYMEADKNE
jgi:hypothetical protein